MSKEQVPLNPSNLPVDEVMDVHQHSQELKEGESANKKGKRQIQECILDSHHIQRFEHEIPFELKMGQSTWVDLKDADGKSRLTPDSFWFKSVQEKNT